MLLQEENSCTSSKLQKRQRQPTFLTSVSFLRKGCQCCLTITQMSRSADCCVQWGYKPSPATLHPLFGVSKLSASLDKYKWEQFFFCLDKLDDTPLLLRQMPSHPNASQQLSVSRKTKIWVIDVKVQFLQPHHQQQLLPL